MFQFLIGTVLHLKKDEEKKSAKNVSIPYRYGITYKVMGSDVLLNDGFNSL